MNEIQKLLEDLVSAAKAEDWEEIDSVKIPRLAAMDDSQFAIYDWIVGSGLVDGNKNVRDVAASLFAEYGLKSNHVSEVRIKKGHDELLKMLEDKHPYARYRAAFAISKHDLCKKHADHIVILLPVLREAAKDKDVSDIAKAYLKKY